MPIVQHFLYNRPPCMQCRLFGQPFKYFRIRLFSCLDKSTPGKLGSSAGFKKANKILYFKR